MNIQLYMSYAEEWTPEYYGHVNTYMAHISQRIYCLYYHYHDFLIVEYRILLPLLFVKQMPSGKLT